jgi:hypothetical protein
MVLSLSPVIGWGEEERITITQPLNNAVVDNSFELQFTVSHEAHGNHVHWFLDGKLQGPIKSSSVKVRNLKPGKHLIEVKMATKTHNLMDVSDKVEITVK